MRIYFAPLQLEEARQTNTLRQICSRLAPEDTDAELRVVQVWTGQPLKLVMHLPGGREAESTIEKEHLYAESPEPLATEIEMLFERAFRSAQGATPGEAKDSADPCFDGPVRAEIVMRP
ncbi:MAG TPA: hypothetical protein VGH90_08435 [Chthoniobacteraceae bacterium]|jgi:hypothetical protein